MFKHTLQPSHIFFTELRTFIPLICPKAIPKLPLAIALPVFRVTLFNAAAEKVRVVEGLKRQELAGRIVNAGNVRRVRAVRRREVDCIIFVDCLLL
jgi:hypothetical protein